MARYQPPEANAAAREVRPGDPSDAELDKGAEDDLLKMIKHAPDVEVSLRLRSIIKTLSSTARFISSLVVLNVLILERIELTSCYSSTTTFRITATLS